MSVQVLAQVLAGSHRCHLPSVTVNDAQTVGSPIRRAVPLSRVAGRACARPGCPAPARATLSFSYADRRAWLRPLTDVVVPEHYDLCGGHADRTAAPHRWTLVDERPDPGPDLGPDPGPDAGGQAPAEVVATADARPTLAAADTVAVLAAALGRRTSDAADPAADGDDLVPDIEDDARLFPLSTSEPQERASTW